MRRMQNYLLLGLLCMVICFSSVQVIGVQTTTWPMFCYNTTRTGYTQSPAPTNTLDWVQTISGGSQSSPAITEHYLYVGTMDGHIYCLSTDTGAIVWSNTTESSIITRSSPAIDDNKVYIGGKDGNLYCFYADNGRLAWKYPIGGPILSSPVVINGYVYIGSNNNNLYCIEADTGNLRWYFPTNNDITSSPAVYNNKVYVGSNDQTLYCIYAEDGSPESGTLNWQYDTQGVVSSTPTVHMGKVYVGSGDNTLYCFDAVEGSLLWSNTTGDAIYSSPAVAGNFVFIGSEDHYLYCFHKDTGEKQWMAPTNGNIQSSPAVAGNHVYVASYDQHLYCFDKTTGDQQWKEDLDAQITASPAIANGYLFITTQASTDNVYCFGQDNQPPNTPQTPQGPPKGEPAMTLTYSSRASDPEQHQVFLQFNWGDGTTSNWLGPHPSGESITATHTYETSGSYSIKVKAKDTGGEESSWSATTTITIQDTSSDPVLFISTSPQVISETDDFAIIVTDVSQQPVTDASVAFDQTVYTTDDTGQVLVTAPPVNEDADYTITAAKAGYQSATVTITILNIEQHTTTTGFIFGRVTDTQGMFLESVRLCFMPENDETTSTCTFTNTTGIYSKILPMGTYAISAEKPGYETYLQTDILIHADEPVELNIQLEIPTKPSSNTDTIAELAIHEATQRGHVAAQIDFNKGQEPTVQYFTTYDVYVDNIQQTGETIAFTVGAPEGTPQKYITVFLGKDVLSTDEFTVTFDGQPLEQLTIAEFLNPQEDTPIGYILMIGEQGTHLAINAHFSEHIITISPAVNTLLTLLLVIYLAGAVIAGVVFYVPEYVTYFKKVR